MGPPETFPLSPSPILHGISFPKGHRPEIQEDSFSPALREAVTAWLFYAETENPASLKRGILIAAQRCQERSSPTSSHTDTEELRSVKSSWILGFSGQLLLLTEELDSLVAHANLAKYYPPKLYIPYFKAFYNCFASVGCWKAEGMFQTAVATRATSRLCLSGRNGAAWSSPQPPLPPASARAPSAPCAGWFLHLLGVWHRAGGNQLWSSGVSSAPLSAPFGAFWPDELRQPSHPCAGGCWRKGRRVRRARTPAAPDGCALTWEAAGCEEGKSAWIPGLETAGWGGDRHPALPPLPERSPVLEEQDRNWEQSRFKLRQQSLLASERPLCCLCIVTAELHGARDIHLFVKDLLFVLLKHVNVQKFQQRWKKNDSTLSNVEHLGTKVNFRKITERFLITEKAQQQSTKLAPMTSNAKRSQRGTETYTWKGLL